MQNSIFPFLSSIWIVYQMCHLCHCSETAPSQQINPSESQGECYVEINEPSPNSTGTWWRLVWEEQFNSPLTNDWIIDHEESTAPQCHGNTLKPVLACNARDNVRQEAGFLVMTAKQKRYSKYNFTASTITTQAFPIGYGRLEIRAAQPIGEQLRTRLLTMNTTALFKQGQINVGSSTMDTVLYRDVVSNKFYDSADLSLFEIENRRTDLHEFHVYGMEWTPMTVRLFFDGRPSKNIKFNYTTGLTPPHQFQIQMGVGERDLEKPKGLDRFEDLEWDCPAFIIDYIRFFEAVPKANDTIEFANYTLCPDPLNAATENATLIESICNRMLENIDHSFWSKIVKYWRYILIGAGVLLLLILILYLVYLVMKMKRKIAKDPFASFSKQSTTSGDAIYEEYIYEEANWRNYSEKERSYTKLYEGQKYEHVSEVREGTVHCEYVPISEGSGDGTVASSDAVDYSSYGNVHQKRYVSMKGTKSEAQLVQRNKSLPLSSKCEEHEQGYVNIQKKDSQVVEKQRPDLVSTAPSEDDSYVNIRRTDSQTAQSPQQHCQNLPQPSPSSPQGEIQGNVNVYEHLTVRTEEEAYADMQRDEPNEIDVRVREQERAWRLATKHLSKIGNSYFV